MGFYKEKFLGNQLFIPYIAEQGNRYKKAALFGQLQTK